MHLFFRPQTLEPGQSYLSQAEPLENIRRSYSVVIFHSYTACPFFVIVQDEFGTKKRLPRDRLFSPTAPILNPKYDLA